MINFKSRDHLYIPHADNAEDKEIDARYIADIKKRTTGSARDKFELGCKLIEYYNSKSYALHVQDPKIKGKYPDVTFGFNGSSKTFFAVCDVEFGLDESQVRRLMDIVDEFGDEFIGFRKEYAGYKYSALVEMLPLLPSERKRIKATWTIREIREYKDELKAVAKEKREEAENATSHENDDDQDDRYADCKPAELRRILVQRDDRINELERELERYRNGEKIRELEAQISFYQSIAISQTN